MSRSGPDRQQVGPLVTCALAGLLWACLAATARGEAHEPLAEDVQAKRSVEDGRVKTAIPRRQFEASPVVTYLPSALRQAHVDQLRAPLMTDMEESVPMQPLAATMADDPVPLAQPPTPLPPRLRGTGLIPAPPPHAPRAGKILEDIQKERREREQQLNRTFGILSTPTEADNSAGLPPVGDQGAQDSCVAWALGYYVKSFQEGAEHGWDLSNPTNQFSPAFLYNQLQSYDEGSTFPDTLSLLARQGCANMAQTPYDETDYLTWPSAESYREAIPYRAASYDYLGMGETPAVFETVKAIVADGDLCAVGIPVFRRGTSEDGLFDAMSSSNHCYFMPAATDKYLSGYHAVTIVGYDASKFDGLGGYKIVNSWGADWGAGGFAWLSEPFLTTYGFDLYRMTDRVGYQPTASIRFKLQHSNWWYDRVTVTVGIGPVDEPLWSMALNARIPRENLTVDRWADISEAVAFLPPNWTDRCWLKIKDGTELDGGILSVFELDIAGTNQSAAVSLPFSTSLWDSDSRPRPRYAYIPAEAASADSYYLNDSSTEADVYCTAPGDDANDGLTPATPKRTLQAVVSSYSLLAGNRVYIDTGIYSNATSTVIDYLDKGAPGNPIEFVGAPSQGATVLTGPDDCPAILNINDSSHLTFHNLTISGGRTGVNCQGTQAGLNGSHDDYITFQNVHFSGASDDACRLVQVQPAVFLNCTLHSAGRAALYMTGCDAEIRQSTLYVEGTADGISAGSGIVGYVDNMRVELANSILRAENGMCFHNRGYAYVTSAAFNNLYVEGSGSVGFSPDSSNIGRDALFADPAAGDFHLLSAAGRWDASAAGRAGAWVMDSQTSPSIDAGDFEGYVWDEPAVNGGRLNQGAYAGTAYASKSPAPTRFLLLDTPAAGASFKYTCLIEWRAYGDGWQAGDTLRAEHSRDGGETWAAVAGGVVLDVAAGRHDWDLAGVLPGASHLVRLTWTQDLESVSVTSGVFAVESFHQRATYYVNDTSTVHDVTCTAIGSDTHDGLTPATPKASVQAVLDTYTLGPGDVVSIDTGEYLLTNNIVVAAAHSGDAVRPVRFVGSSHPDGSRFDRNDTGATAYAFLLDHCSYVSLERLTMTGAYDGIVLSYANHCEVTQCRSHANAARGVIVNSSHDTTLRNVLADGNGGAGIGVAWSDRVSLVNNTVARNGADQVSLTGDARDLVFLNNIVAAAGSGGCCVYKQGGGNALMDYNVLHATNGASVFRTGWGSYAVSYGSMAGWRAATGRDLHSIEADPRFVDAAAGDFHLRSTGGSWHGGAWSADAEDSPCLDAGDPTVTFGEETEPHGGRVNLGAFGGTAEASRTPAGRGLVLLAPIGAEIWRGTNDIRWLISGDGWQEGDSLALEYSADTGETWQPIAGGQAVHAAAGSYAWDTATAVHDVGWHFMVRLVCNQDVGVRAMSGATFRLHNRGIDYFVNDGSSSNDVYCTAIGDEANDGRTSATPMASLNALLARYDLEPGDTVYVDTGYYPLTANVTLWRHSAGSSNHPVRIVGSTHEEGTVLDRGLADGSTGYVSGIRVEAADHIRLERLAVTRANIGIWINGATDIRVERCRLYDNVGSSHGNAVRIQSADTVTLARNVIYGNNGYGVLLESTSHGVELINNTIALNGSYPVCLRTPSGSVAMRNNILWASGFGSYCIMTVADPWGAVSLAESDHNALHATDGARIGYLGRACETLAEWQATTGHDVNSLSGDPDFVGAAAGDFHLRSSGGSWRAGGIWVMDATSSPCIDGGDPGDGFDDEPEDNGERINLGAYGGTEQASKRPAGRALALLAPDGGETWRGTRSVRWHSAGDGWQTNDTLRLDCSLDGGSTWQAIPDAAMVPFASGLYQWDTTTASPDTGTNVLLRILCNQEPGVSDQSRAPFRLHNSGIDYFVNDSSTSNDVYCTAVGDDANDGLSVATPKATLQAVLDSYDLESGDTVHVDTGYYLRAAQTTIGLHDSGSSNGWVRIVGSPHADGTVFDRNVTGSSNIDVGTGLHLSGCAYVSLENVAVTRARTGIAFSTSEHCRAVGCRVTGQTHPSLGAAIEVISSFDTTLQGNVLCNNAGRGIVTSGRGGLLTVVNCTVAGNGASAVAASLESGQIALRNNILAVAGEGNRCIAIVPYFGDALRFVASSDHNALYATSNAIIAHAVSACTNVVDWQQLSGLDAHSIEVAPLFVDPLNGDFHLQSTEGSWHGGAWTPDATNSPCIDAGSVLDPVGDEPAPHGGRINLGAYGGTAQASKSRPSRRLSLGTPYGGEVWRGSGTVTWLAWGDEAWASGDTVNLLASTDGGTNWMPIAGATGLNALSGAFTWSLDGMASGDAYRLRVEDTANAAIFDESATNFTVSSTAYYVNDASVDGDLYCTAPGDDMHDGQTPATPVYSLKAIFDRYNIEGGDTIYVDSGNYNMAAGVVISPEDGGTTKAPVRIVGVPGRSVLRRNAPTEEGSRCLTVHADSVTIENLDLRGAERGLVAELFGIGAAPEKVTVRGCRFIEHGKHAIHVEPLAYDAVLSGNVILHEGTGAAVMVEAQLAMAPHLRCRVVGNTIVARKGLEIRTESGPYVADNIIVASGTNGWCLQTYYHWGHTSDYNNYVARDGALVVEHEGGRLYSQGKVCETLAEWVAYSGQDAHSLSVEPVFADEEYGDVHLMSEAGRWDPALHGGAGGWTNDMVSSPCIDTGDPSADATRETIPNGGRINMGAYGNTAEASRSPAHALFLTGVGNEAVLRSYVPIRWMTQGTNWLTGETVHLDYSADSGTHWAAVADATGLSYDAGQFWWDTRTVPNGSRYRVRVVSDDAPVLSATAARDYRIDNNLSSPVLAWTGEPGYTTNGVDPDSAIAGTTTFVFRVAYADSDNDPPAPGYPRLHIRKGGVPISGSPFTLSAVDPAATNIVAGVVYTLSQAALIWGDDYTHTFEAMDTRGAPADGEPTAWHDGPTVVQRQPGVFAFAAPAYTVGENEGEVTISVVRTEGSNLPATVAYSTRNGTAVAGDDYLATSGVLDFDVGVANRTFGVTVFDNVILDGDRTVHLDLANPTGGATLGDDSVAMLTISDNDTDRQLALDHPVGGEVFTVGAVIPVTWSVAGTDWEMGDRVKLEWSDDGGVTWSPVIGAEALDHDAESFAWDTSDRASGTAYRLRVSWCDDPILHDVLGSDFRLRHVYYVNDSSTNLTVWCSAPGNDANDGLTPATPKATVQAVLAAADLASGDRVRIDTGNYALSANIEVASRHGGTSANPLVFEASPYGVTFDRGSTTTGSYGWHINGASYVTLRTARSAAHPGMAQRWLRVMGANIGIHVAGTYCRLERVDATANLDRGIHIGASFATVENCLARGSTHNTSGTGIYVNGSNATLNNCTVEGNARFGIYIWWTSGTTLRNNIVCADGDGDYGVYRSSTGFTLTSDCNDIFAVNGAHVGYSGEIRTTLADWQAATGCDGNSLSLDPLIADADGGDFHLKSVEGRYAGGQWVSDTAHSPCIDAGDPASDWAAETYQNGGRVNMGAYGNTKFASKSLTNATHTIMILSAHGDATPPIGEHLYYDGTALACHIAPQSYAVGTTQYVCTGWSLAGGTDTNGHASGIASEVGLVLTNNVVLTWQWATNHWLALAITGSGTVDRASGWIEAGSNVTVTATATPHWHFVEWTGDTNECVIVEPLIDIPMDRARALEAVFAIDAYTVSFDPGAHGTRTGGGELVQVVDHGAAALAPELDVEAGWSFIGWDTEFSFISDNLTVSAHYAPAILDYRGVNLCGAEFGVWTDTDHDGMDDHFPENVPGIHGTHYRYPDAAAEAYFLFNGLLTVRLPFRWERLQPSLSAGFDAAELARLRAAVASITAQGGRVILDARNFARYYGDAIGSAHVSEADFAAFWGLLAAEFGANDRVIFGLMNEPHSIRVEAWLSAANAAIQAIRGAGAANLILVPGINWTGAFSWYDDYGYGTNAATMQGVVDQAGNFAFDVHLYFDADNSGTSDEVLSPTIGPERLADFVAWCRQHGVRAFLGEVGAPESEAGLLSLRNTLHYLEQRASDVFLGWTYWTAAPHPDWATGLRFNILPENPADPDPDDRPQMAVLREYLPPVHTVTFVLGDYGIRSGGGALRQAVRHGVAAQAPHLAVAAGWTFSGWGTDFDAVTGPLTVNAEYERILHELSVASAYGEPEPAVGTNTYAWGTELTAAVASPETLGTTQYVCVGWIGTGSVPPEGVTTSVSFALTNDTAITWQWATNYWLETGVNGNGAVDVESGWFPLGTNVTLTATPVAYHHFTGWSGDTNGAMLAGHEIAVPMDGPRSIQASFAVDMYTLRYLAGPGGRTEGVATQTVEHGTDGAEVAASPDDGAVFTRWSDGLTTASRTDTNVTENITVTAFFRSVGGVPIEWYDGHGFSPEAGEDWSAVDGRDPHGKGMTLREEFVAMTDPHNPTSVFRVIAIDLGPPPTVSVEPCSTQRVYTLQYRVSLTEASWTNVSDQVCIPGGPPLTDESTQTQRFYRVIVEMQ
jgi:endoglucanase